MSGGCLVIGASGMLGQRLVAEARQRGEPVGGAARSGAEHALDATDAVSVEALLERLRPVVVWNAAAQVDLAGCDADPGAAYAINTHAVATMARWCARNGARLVQVSTDHYYTGDADRAHDETAAVRLINTYAASKYAAEAVALTCPGALVLRTNITGRRGDRARPTFSEWLFEQLAGGQPLRLFTDYYTSTMDTGSFARAGFDLLASGASGLFNLASRSISSKHDFVLAVARVLGRCPPVQPASVAELAVARAESLGLDVSRAEAALGYDLPDLATVAQNLVTEHLEKRT